MWDSMLPARPEYLPLDAVRDAGDVLAVIVFGEVPDLQHVLAVALPIPQLGTRLVEVWRASGTVRRGRVGDLEFAHNGEVMFGAIRRDARSIVETTAGAYEAVLGTATAAGYPHLLRAWNYVSAINEEQEGLERYRGFSAGRHEAMTSHGYSRTTFPAAAAVGMSGSDLAVCFLSAREPGIQVENPRQLSAYDYPERYGPRSPSFSRATLMKRGSSAMVLVSGTASVVGHESRHQGRLVAQIEETLQNLDLVIREAAARVDRSASVRDLTVARAYIRDAAHAPVVAQYLRQAMPAASHILLHSDICRQELLVEIEGVAVLE